MVSLAKQIYMGYKKLVYFAPKKNNMSENLDNSKMAANYT